MPGLPRRQRGTTIHPLAGIGKGIKEHRAVPAMEEHEGKTGPMAIVRSDQGVTADNGEKIETLISPLIVRPPPVESTGSLSSASQAETAGDLPLVGPDQLIVPPDILQSFLFNAAVWAVRRIHWDVPYARFEGLPSTLIVGWNLANFIARLGKKIAAEGMRLHRIDHSYGAIAHSATY